MNDYIITLIGTVLVCSLAAMLAPEESGMLGYVKLAAGLCVLCVAIAPLTSFIREATELSIGEGFLDIESGENGKFGEIYEGSILGASEESASLGLRAMICRDFGLDSDEVEVRVHLSDTGKEYKAQSVTVALVGGKAIFTDPHEIIAYVTETLGCNCEIIYGEGVR